MTWTRSPFTPLVLLIEDQEWTARSFESILSPHGCGVFKAYTGRQGLEVVQRLIPDLILVDRRLPDMTGIQVLSQLRKVDTVRTSTPRVLISTSPVTSAERMTALEEGAWDILVPPFDSAELILRFDTWIAAKRDADKARDEGLVDPLTGLYNFNGLLRRIDELVSDASRSHRALSVVAFGAPHVADEATSEEADEDEDREGVARNLGKALGHAARLSDAIARIGRDEFVIVAPGTDLKGAETLARRILEVTGAEAMPLRAGIYSAPQAKSEPGISLDLINRATTALRRAQARAEGPPVFTEEMLN
ncbi:MAG: response regulator [Gemmatimonadota bacterium]|jgi:diguanylate cyclase (GGDEF)-like protein